MIKIPPLTSIAAYVFSTGLVFGSVVYWDKHKNDQVSKERGFILTEQGFVIVPTEKTILKLKYNFEKETVSYGPLGFGHKRKADELSYFEFLIYKHLQKEACDFAAGKAGYSKVCFELRSSIDTSYEPY